MEIRTISIKIIEPDYDHPDMKRFRYYPNSSLDQIMDDNYDYNDDNKLMTKRKKHDNIIPYVRNKRYTFDRRTLTYYILGGCNDTLKKYLDLAEKLNMKKKILLDYERFKKYREICSCSACIVPCVKMAFKRGYFKNMRWVQFLKDYNQE